MSDSNKTEKPTPRRRQKAREEGQIARSRELSSIAATVGVFAVLVWETPSLLQHWTRFFRRSIEVGCFEPLLPSTPVLFWASIETARWIAGPLLIGLVLSALFGIAQGGFVFAPAALSFKFERLSPANKIQQLFSPAGLSGFLKSIIPFGAIIYFSVAVIQQYWVAMAQATALPLQGIVNLIVNMTFAIAWRTAIILAIWAGVDYLLTWWKLEGDLKMSKDELRQEMKDTEGNPTIKLQIRKIQRSLRRREMLQAAEGATVVVTNPTHFAVALKYELEMEVPLVVAKGQDLLAQEIKAVAYSHAIPVFENPPLAQALYRTTEVGAAIPSKLYTAVAEVLAFVFRAQAQAKQEMARRAQMFRESRQPS